MTKTNNRKLKVFLCHASEDKVAVRELYQRLSAESWIDPWLDEEKLLPGQDWDVEIEKAAEDTDAVIICLSDSSINKEGYVQKELRIVLDVALRMPEDTIFLLPLRLEECILPRKLRKLQYTDYFPNEQKQWAYGRLLRSLKTRADSKKLLIPLEKKYTTKGHRLFLYGGIDFLLVPKGSFIMGAEEEIANIYEGPKHVVDLPYKYWISRYPVTNTQFSQFVRSSGTSFQLPQGEANHPVTKVNWREAKAFTLWLQETTLGSLPDGYAFCLPSEAEWEKAARGEDGQLWPWGNKFDSTFCNSRENGKGTTTPVNFYDGYGDSPYGVSDMSGNICEWTRSRYALYPYVVDDGREVGKPFDSYALRGGSYFDNRIDVRCSTRKPGVVSGFEVAVGFRMAIVPVSFCNESLVSNIK